MVESVEQPCASHRRWWEVLAVRDVVEVAVLLGGEFVLDVREGP